MSGDQYACGEAITKSRIQDESWYPDFQAVTEVMTAGPDDDDISFFERLPDGFDRAMAAVKKYFQDYPGPDAPPDDERLARWIRATWMSEDSMARIETVFETERQEKTFSKTTYKARKAAKEFGEGIHGV